MKKGELVIVVSPYLHVTADGKAKSRIPGNQSVVGHVQDPTSESWKSVNIPYGTIGILLDDVAPLVLCEGAAVMLPKSCIKILNEEN